MIASEPDDPVGPPDDGEVVATLVAAASAGEPAAWDALVERFSGLVWAIARAHRLNSADAAEVTQTVWLKLVENLDRLRDPRRLGAWLATVTRHECLRSIRHAGRVTAVADVGECAPAPAPTGVKDVDAGLLADERNTALWSALNRLPPQWAALMRLLVVEPPLSYAEMAAALDIPIGSIGPIRQRGLRRLRTSPEITAIAGVAS